MDDNSNTLISTDWLAYNLKNPNVRIIDASWYLPDMDRNAKEEYDKEGGRGYRLFENLGTSPNVIYLKKVEESTGVVDDHH